MSGQISLLQKFMMKAQADERKLIPRILVPQGVNTTFAVQKAIDNGFPVTYCAIKFVAPSQQYGKHR